MRTTLDIDEHLHAVARRKAFDERRSLGEVISELALRGLEATSAAQRPARELGRFAGMIHVSDDFDTTPESVADAVEQPLA